jgi:hypothetical protein
MLQLSIVIVIMFIAHVIEGMITNYDCDTLMNLQTDLFLERRDTRERCLDCLVA